MRATLNVRLRPMFFLGVFAASGALAEPPQVSWETYTAHASSQLAGKGGLYAPAQVVAPSLHSAWCEGVPGDGKGEWLELDLKHPMTSDAGFDIEILPGYAANHAAFLKNNRPRTLAVSINGDQTTRQLALQDYDKFQSFYFKWQGKPVKKIRLALQDAYKGTQYTDTCITDIAVRQRVPLHYWDDEEQIVRTGHEPDNFTELDWSQRDSAMLARLNLKNPGRDPLSLAMALSEGMYFNSAEGSETLGEIYMDALIHDPRTFLWVLDKQSDAVAAIVSKAIISPVNDQYSEAQIRRALAQAMKQLDIGSPLRLSPLMRAYGLTAGQ